MVQSYGNVTTKGTQLSNQKVISKQCKFLVLLHQRDTQTTAAILNSSLTRFLAPRRIPGTSFLPVPPSPSPGTAGPSPSLPLRIPHHESPRSWFGLRRAHLRGGALKDPSRHGHSSLTG